MNVGINAQNLELLTSFGSIALVMLLESFWPRRPVALPLMRWINNLALAALNDLVVLLTLPWIALALRAHLALPQGLIPALDLGTLPAFLLTLLLLELSGYWIHRGFHAIPVLWRWHAVHHCDIEFDATTSHRHHPLEVILSGSITLFILIALDVAPGIALACGCLQLVVAAFSHGNLRLNHVLERTLGVFFVTPDFHRVHHAAQRPFTDSNFSNTLPWVDWLFGTARHFDDTQRESMPMGLEYCRAPQDSYLWALLAMPFHAVFPREN